MIQVQDLHVQFGHGADVVQALRGVSFQVAKGESFGLVGESGSGKSTVLKALCGLCKDWQGTLHIDGQLQTHKRTAAFYKLLQMVFQDPYGSLHPRHTVDRVLSEAVAIQSLGQVSKRVQQVLDAVGLNRGFRFRYPHQLSGGQRQRVAIARALVLEPKILLLDEPTSALDVSVQAEILNLLTRLRRELNLTSILVSHNLAVVAHMSDRLMVMKDGAVVEELSSETLAAGTPAHPYTRQLLQASRGYDREAIDAFVDIV